MVWWCFTCFFLRKECFTVFKVKVTAKVQNVTEYLSGRYCLRYLTFCSRTLYDNAPSWAGRKHWSRSQWGFMSLKYDRFYNIFRPADPFAPQLSLVVRHHSPVLWQDWIAVFKVMVAVMVQTPLNVCRPSASKVDMYASSALQYPGTQWGCSATQDHQPSSCFGEAAQGWSVVSYLCSMQLYHTDISCYAIYVSFLNILIAFL